MTNPTLDTAYLEYSRLTDAVTEKEQFLIDSLNNIVELTSQGATLQDIRRIASTAILKATREPIGMDPPPEEQA